MNTNRWPHKAVWVDLGRKKIKVAHISKSFARHYLGSRGFNSRKLYDLVKPEIDPLSPENPLLFAVGPLTGTLAPASSRFTVSAKSPLTDVLGCANSSGGFAPELRYAGYSQLIFFGKSQEPVYVWVDDGHIDIKDASHVWGKGTWDTQEIIEEELGDPSTQVICIGPAGENQVRFGNIITGLTSAAGRTGMGAVMGSKNLKAIAVRGTKDIEIPDPDEFKRACKLSLEFVENGANTQTWKTEGTLFILEVNSMIGALSTRNYASHVFPATEKLSGRRFKKDFSVKMRGCFGCPLNCRHFHVVTEGKYKGVYGDGPDYALTEEGGARAGIEEMEPLLYAWKMLNHYGMDVFSFFATVAWAMDCYERGIITKEDTDGLAIKWGDSEAAIELLHLTAERKGIGNILAEGEKRAPTVLGRGSEKCIYHIKGMSPPSLDPRVAKGFATGFYTSTRGGDHLRALFGTTMLNAFSKEFLNKVFPGIPSLTDDSVPNGKGLALPWFENYSAVIDSCGVCKFPWLNVVPHPLEKMPEIMAILVSKATGFEMDSKAILRIGERVYNVEKAFNTREGLTGKDDDITNSEFTKKPVEDGPGKGRVYERDEILNDYYEARGWDKKSGLQTREKLEELGLKDIADGLFRAGTTIEHSKETK